MFSETMKISIEIETLLLTIVVARLKPFARIFVYVLCKAISTSWKDFLITCCSNSLDNSVIGETSASQTCFTNGNKWANANRN